LLVVDLTYIILWRCVVAGGCIAIVSAGVKISKLLEALLLPLVLPRRAFTCALLLAISLTSAGSISEDLRILVP
jgi:hypothetical protein